MKMRKIRKFLIGCAIGLVVLVSIFGGAVADRLFGLKPLDLFLPHRQVLSPSANLPQKVLTEESVVIDVVQKVSASVVTVSIRTPQRRILDFGPFGFTPRIQGGEPQDIGTGFIVSSDGLIVTNKHVVSDTTAKYQVITSENKTYPVKQISRDPNNDIAILKIDASGLKPVELGDSSNLKVGQFVIAIGTALGEFRNTVTTGVVSGLGRGITAGSPLEGYVEKLDDVIQTDAAINPGNSGGPLLNSAGQVIGVNVAIAQGAQNIGFALPINIVKNALNQFKTTGRFPAKPFLGVQYQIISRQTAILNDVPQGALIIDVVDGSPAQKVGIKPDDIITKIDGESINSENSLADAISKKQVGDKVAVEIWRDGETLKFDVTLAESNE